MKSNIGKILTGVAGEYFVAAELSKRGYIASITLKNTKGVDILCSNSETSKAIGIQVKTNSGSKKSWFLSQKAETYFADNLFYVFVNLKSEKEHPDFFIVPSKIVAKYCKENHKKWLETPGKRKKVHKDGPIRKFDDFDEKYKNKWDIIENFLR